MNKHFLSAESLMDAFPQVLKNDANLNALATSIADVLAKRREEIAQLDIYSRIDELPDELLDILAYDFKVDWWDYDYTVEQKRKTLKGSWHVHRHLGTKYAVETAISAIYPRTSVQEWFEYGGAPYTFRLLINVSNLLIELDAHTHVLELAEYYKNLRSQLSDIEYTVEANESAIVRVGGLITSIVCIHIPELADDFTFESAARLGGRLSTVASVSIPSMDESAASPVVRTVRTTTANITTISMPDPQDE